VIPGSLGRRYAKALLDLAVGLGKVDAIGREVEDIAAVVASSPELAHALSSPVFKVSQRKRILEELATRRGLSKEVRAFLAMLADRERTNALPSIARELRTMVDGQLGRVRATVTSAKALTADQESRVRTAIEKQTGKQVLLEKKEDASLIGGMVTQIGDVVWDGSIKQQLEEMKETILEQEQHFA
jgi:F-type H+-transporting ATPase subunit delta